MKKFTSFIAIASIIFNIIPTQNLYASSDLNASLFSVEKQGSSWSKNFVPWDKLKISFWAQNNSGQTLDNLNARIDFPSVDGMTYDWTTDIWVWSNNEKIEPGEFTSTWFNVNTALTLWNWEYYSVYDDTAWGITLWTGVTTPTLTLEGYLKAKKWWVDVESNHMTYTINIDVRPHIIDYYFTEAWTSTIATTIKWQWWQTRDLYVKVKDLNLCENLDWTNVTADLSALWIWNQTLSYISCENSNTAIFKKAWISTLNDIWQISMPYTIFSYSDEDWNSILPTDTNFWGIDKKDDLEITVTSPWAPTVTNIAITDDYIWSASEPSSQISFSANQTWTYKIALDSCDQADANKIFQDYTAYWTSWVQIDYTINASDLADWANNVFACVKNSSNEVGSTTFTITKDTTVPAFVGSPWNTASVSTEDAHILFTCNENWTYKIERTAPSALVITAPEFLSLNASTPYDYTVPNASLIDWSNTLKLTCRDNAGNIVTKDDISITKVSSAPSMAWRITLFEDADTDNDWIDWRDFHITWDNTPASTYDYFNAWFFYILPSSTAFNEATHWDKYIQTSTNKSLNDITLDSSVTKDSLENNLVWGWEYKVYVLINSTSWDLWTPAESNAVVITADVVQHADIVSARFITWDKLEVTTDATLDTNLGSHNAALISYNIWATTYNPTSVASIDWQKIIYNIPSLWGATNTTWTTLVAQANAIRSNWWGYNNLINFSGSITDWIEPSITSFQNNTAAWFWTFWKTSINLWWTISEDLDIASTLLKFERTSWNNDTNTHNIPLNSSDITSWAHTKDIDVPWLTLVCWTTYKISLTPQDTAWNTADASEIANFSYDNCGPSTPTLNEFTTSWNTDVDFSWNASTDDSGNGSWVKNYKLEIFTWNDCSTSNQVIDSIATTNKTVTLTTWDFSWKITARDNMDNLSEASACSNFSVNTNVPAFSNETITDTNLTSTAFTKTWNTIQVTADITNTDIDNINADLSPLTWWAFTDVPCNNTWSANITCTYVWWKVTYSFPVWFWWAVTEGLKQIQLKAKNTTGLNEQTNNNANITLDTAIPTVWADTITSPNWWETLWWNEITITWDTTKISDTTWLKEVELFYKWDTQVAYTSIYKWPNSWSFAWDTTALNSANDYSIKLVAYDNVLNEWEDTTDADFSIDKNAPVVPANTVQIPNWWEMTPWDDTITITWNAAWITDAWGLKANPITLSYTTNWTDYYEIATNLANSWSYDWTVPKVNLTTAKIKLVAEDIFWNTAEDTSDSSFGIDSIIPNVALSYAWWGWTTPSSSSYLNNSWMDISGTSSDDYMDKVVYILKNTTDNTYYNWTTYVVWEQTVTMCTDWQALWTDNSCDNIWTTINPLIEAGKTYEFKIRSIDEAWNYKDSPISTYNADLGNPNLSVTTADNTYVKSDINITWTASDTISWMSAVKVQIKRNSDNFYYNWTTFVNSLTNLDTTTSDNFANWSYNFTVPATDAEWETYAVKTIAYDKAYKTNNTTEIDITLLKDSTGPTIAWGNNFISAPTTWDMFAGWVSTNITWNPANISDSASWVKANSVTLEYFDWSSYTEIANSLPNSWTYNWASLPALNSNVVRVRFGIEDVAWNISRQLSNAFTIDSTPPTIDSVETMENWITNWKINSLKVTFSESIKDSSVNLAHFTIWNWIWNPTALETWATANDNIIILRFAETWTTASTPNLTYAWDSIEDLAWKKLANAWPINSLDKASPRMLETNVYDDDKNWKLDKIEIVFSENIAASTTLNWFTLNNAYAWMSLNALTVTSDKINITLNESSNYNTAVWSLSLSLNNTIYTDSSSNLAWNFTANALVDKAPPVKVSAITKDNDNFWNAWFWKIDQILMTMSENLVWANLWDFAVWNLASWSSAASLSTSSNIITFTINETSDNNDTAQIPTINYTPWTLRDSDWNNTESIPSFNVSDWISPIITARETIDNDWDWQIDRIKLTLSENLTDNLWWINVDVSWYTVNSYTTWTSSDNIVYAIVNEKVITDTSATPNVKLLSNSTLVDWAWNTVIAEPSFTTTTDKVWPIIIWARYDEAGAWVADDKIYLTFSENISAASIDTSAWWASNDFVIVWWWAFSWNSTTSINSATEVVITMWAWATALSSATSKVWIKTSALEDSLNNPSPTAWSNNQIALSWSVVINEIMYASTVNNQYIELRNLWDAPVSLDNWVIENAWWNGVNITIPVWQTIWANGYYLISKTNQATSIINVAPNLVDATLNLNPNGQNNLVLKNSISTFDSALANYPAWNKDIPKAMERKNVPWNWLTAWNWYTAESSVWFDNDTPKWTPGSANIFDSNAPTIDSFTPNNNELFWATPTVWFTYSDDIVWVDNTSSTFAIQKWNWTDAYWADLSGTKLNSSNVVASQADYTLKPLDYGKYKVTFTIDDKVWNTATQIIEFYVDEFNMTVTTTPLDIWDLEAGNLVTSTNETTITITTIWAWFNLNADKSSIITSSSSNIIDWDWNTWFWIDIYKDENWSISSYDWNIVQLNNVTLWNISKNIDPNWNLKTYTYKIKYWAKIDGVQSAWTYNTNSIFTTSITYE